MMVKRDPTQDDQDDQDLAEPPMASDMGTFRGIADEDFKEAGSSSAPTKDSEPDAEDFQSDDLVDEPTELEGDKTECGASGQVAPGSVVKEIVELGTGFNRPRLSHLCKISFVAYFYDHTVFDSSNEQEIEIFLGDIAWPEGLWRGI